MMSSTLQLQMLLFSLMKQIKGNMEEELMKSKANITVLQYSVLKKLTKGTRTLQQLAQDLGLRPPSLVPSIKFLEKAQLIERIPDVQDGRKVQLIITSKAVTLLASIPLQEGAPLLHEAVDKIGIHKTQELIQLLQEFNNAFSK